MLKFSLYLMLFVFAFGVFFVPVVINAQGTTFWNLERDTGVTTPNALNFYLTNGGVAQSKAMTILQNGNVGIGTTAPGAANLYVVGKIAAAPSGTTADMLYNGNVVVTKPVASGQYLNMIRSGAFGWSLGYVYNTNTFAIGAIQPTDSNFTSPAFAINTLGDVGIGTAAPVHQLQVAATDPDGIGYTTTDFNAGTNAGSVLQIQLGASTGNTYSKINALSAGWSAWNNLVLQSGGGNVGIGTTAPAGKLDVQILSNKHIGFVNWNNEPTLGAFNDGLTNWAPTLVIAPGGTNVGVGTYTPSAKLQVAGDTRVDGKIGINGYQPGNCNAGPPAGTYGLCLGGSGYAQVAWAQGSDIRFKKDIQPLQNSLQKVLALQGVSFKYNRTIPNGDKYPETTQIGFIAQQVESIVPEVVTTNSDGYKAMSYANLTSLLTEAIKEQQTQIDDLKRTGDSQQAEIELLKSEINLLKEELKAK